MRRRPSPVDVAVGHNIRMYRMTRSLSQRELGQRIGVALRQIQKYESGENRVSAGRLMQIAVVLGVSFPTLLEDSPVATVDDDQSARALLAKRYSVRLVQAFDRIPQERMRMAVLEMIEAIGRANHRRR
jgi:transcriptional regulator with XRE-family HTH domain